MSGHNKWSTIKRKKGAIDAKRSKMFSKLIKDITIAVKERWSRSRWKSTFTFSDCKCQRRVSMPKDNIQRAISKGADKDAASFQETTYEGYAPNGIAIFIECTTDNLQRTVSNIRSYFNKYGGNLGTNGSLSFLFDRKGVFIIPKGTIDPDEFEMEIIDAGAEDISLEDDTFTVTTAMEDFGSMMRKLEELKIEPESASLQRIPKETTKLDLEASKKVIKLIDFFEEDDDVQNVYHNMEITDELMDALNQ